MPHTIGTGQASKQLTPNTAAQWIWLFDVEIGASEIAYVTPFDDQITWNGITYYPYPMSFPVVPESKATQQGVAQITVNNIDGFLTDRLRDEELLGNFITVRVVNSDHLSETDVISHRMRMLGASVSRDRRAITITVGNYNWLTKQPGRRFMRLRCHNVYGSAACGYDTARAGAMATCSRLYSDGSNGCVEHGDDEAAAGLFRYHPLRFGGFPALPKQNRG